MECRNRSRISFKFSKVCWFVTSWVLPLPAFSPQVLVLPHTWQFSCTTKNAFLPITTFDALPLLHRQPFIHWRRRPKPYNLPWRIVMGMIRFRFCQFIIFVVFSNPWHAWIRLAVICAFWIFFESIGVMKIQARPWCRQYERPKNKNCETSKELKKPWSRCGVQVVKKQMLWECRHKPAFSICAMLAN